MRFELHSSTQYVLPRRLEPIFQHSFDWIVRHLGLESRPEVVLLELVDQDRESEIFGTRGTTHGAATQDSEGRVRMILTIRDSWLPMLAVLVHEMHHVKQMVEGRLRRGENQIFWEEQSYSRDEVDIRKSLSGLLMGNHRMLPWEQEAWDGQERLFPKLFASLDPAQQETLLRLVARHL